MNCKYIVIVLSFLVLSLSAYAGEIETKKINDRDLSFKTGSTSLTYTNIIGEMDGFFRDLIEINSQPSLFSAAKGETYYTLVAQDNHIKIDCLYSDLRSPENGIRIRRGICGLDQTLGSNYTESALEYTDEWQSEVSQLNTVPLLEHGKPIEFVLNKDSEIEIRQRYSNISDLENSTPDSIVIISGTCYNLGKKNLYMVSQKQDTKAKIKPIVIEPVGEEFIIRDLKDEIRSLNTASCTQTVKS